MLSGAKVRDPQPYSIPVHTFEWVIDRYTVVEPITSEDTSETPLPPPSQLHTISFLDLDKKQLGVEFHKVSTCFLPRSLHQIAYGHLTIDNNRLLAVVANCSALQYTANQTKRYREAIVMDDK